MHTAIPDFWRDSALPYIEARSIRDGRRVCYAAHSHETFSIGAITGGRSTYVNGRMRAGVGAGTVVLMNPEEVHACNPVDDDVPWSYRMFHVEVRWLTGLQRDLGFSPNQDFRPFSARVSEDAVLHAGLDTLYRLLNDPQADPLRKHEAVVSFFTELHGRLNPAPAGTPMEESVHRVQRAADYIDANFAQPLRLDAICAAAGLSESYLIRAFKRRYGMTPHAYLVNRRVQYSRSQLRRGRHIAEVAADAGFADQAHLQRVFKRMVAATPAQYQRGR